MKQQVRSVTHTCFTMTVLLFGVVLLMAATRLYAEEKMPLTLSSLAFMHGGQIPSEYTCEGEDIAPPLQWEGVSSNARTLVLIVDDPDAPDPKAPKSGPCFFSARNMKEADFASFYFVEYFDCIRCSLHDNTAPFFLKIISAFLGEFYPSILPGADNDRFDPFFINEFGFVKGYDVGSAVDLFG